MFANYSEGFRPPVTNRLGGDAAANNTGAFADFRVPVYSTTDTLDNYEIGLKGDFLDGILRVNATGYYSEITDLTNALQAYKTNAINANKAQLKSLLTDEIIKRYFYSEGLYDYYVHHNAEIKKSKEKGFKRSQYQEMVLLASMYENNVYNFNKSKLLLNEAIPELEKLKNSINHLLDTEAQQRSRYKNSLSDLAHSLKTPLAVLTGNEALPNSAHEPLNQIDSIIQRQLKRAVCHTRRLRHVPCRGRCRVPLCRNAGASVRGEGPARRPQRATRP